MAHVANSEPPVVLDAAWSEKLEALAAVAMRGPAAEVGDRLMGEVARATVLPSGEMPGDVVNIGSEVRFRDEATGREQTVSIVLPEGADIAKGRVSVLTPIGAALIGLAAGASIGWETREGEERRLTVLDVRRVGGRRPPKAGCEAPCASHNRKRTLSEVGA